MLTEGPLNQPIKMANPATLLKGRNVEPLLWLMCNIAHLKSILRRGWLRKGRDIPVEKCESDADHCFGLVCLTLFACDLYFPKLDRMKAVSIAIIHEFGEISPGDAIPDDNIPKDERYAAEAEQIIYLFRWIPDGEKWIDLWKDFENGKSPEARLVKELDRLECAFQAGIYHAMEGMPADDFFEWARKAIHSDVLKTLLTDVQLITES